MKLISWNVNGIRGVCAERIPGFFSGGGRGYFLYPGDEDAGGTTGT